MYEIKTLNAYLPNTLMETLAIQFTHWDESSVWAEMPVTPKVHQPYGLLHGGATVALAETVGSVLSATQIDPKKFHALGLNIQSTHLKSVRSGIVTAKATFIKKSKNHHWVNIKVFDSDDNLVHISQLTNAIQAIKS